MIPQTLSYSAASILDYCERYVNNGSPSGYTIEEQLARETNPFSNTKSFPLLVASTNDFKKVSTIGLVPNMDHEDEFFIHPMMTPKYEALGIPMNQTGFRVEPTSSGRTVVTCGVRRAYLKLDFDDVLGRVNRAITYTKAVAGIEIGQILEAGLNDGVINDKVGLLRERGARIVWDNEGTSRAYVFRDSQFWFRQDVPIHFALPLFSLFSEDKKSYRCLSSMEAGCLIERIRRNLVFNPEALGLNIVFPVIDLYFESVIRLGLQIEFNAQNVLVAFDQGLMPIGIILRDFSAVEKDHGLQSGYWPDTFLSAPYKCIYRTDDTYQIRHSFAFDFKLATYVVEPLIDLLGAHGSPERETLMGNARERVTSWIAQVPEGFFPEGCWYSHPKMLLTEKRPYERNDNPLLRTEK